MNDEFLWSVEDFLGKPPLDMILEGLGTLCATPLEVRDPSGGTAALGPAPTGKGGEVLSPIQIHGREAGMVVGYTTKDQDQRVPMTVALAASLISQFLRSTREVRNLTVEVDRRSRGLSLLARAAESEADEDDSELALWFLREALSLVRASEGVLFSVAGQDCAPLAWEGPPSAPRAGAMTRRVARTHEPLILVSLGRLPKEATLHVEGEACPLEEFLTTPALAVPVGFGDRCLGVLWACGHRRGGLFSEADLGLLGAVASQIGLYLWGGRAVDTLRAEEAARRAAEVEEQVRGAYIPGPPQTHPLRLETCEGGASGSVTLSDGRHALWASCCDGVSPGQAAAAAAVARTALEAEAGRSLSPCELVTGAARTLARFEEEGAPRHRLLAAVLGEEGEIEAAWRGLDGPARLQSPGGAQDLEARATGEGACEVFEACFHMPPEGALGGAGDRFRLIWRQGERA